MSGDKEFGGMFSELSVHLGECRQLSQRALERATELDEAGRALRNTAVTWGTIRVGAHQTCEHQVESTTGNPSTNYSEEENSFLPEEELLKMARLKRNLGSLAENSKELELLTQKLAQSDFSNVALPEEGLIAVSLEKSGAKSISKANEILSKTLNFIRDIDLSPNIVNGDLNGPKFIPKLLINAGEKLEEAAGHTRLTAYALGFSENYFRKLQSKLENHAAKKIKRNIAQNKSGK
jgi:hypothetical protein